MASQKTIALSVGMTDVEIRALRLCYPALITEIDPIIVSSTLCEWYPQHRSCHIMLRELRRQYNSSYVTRTFLTELENTISFKDLVHVLYHCRYKKLATRVFLSLISNINIINHINKTHSGQGKQLSKLAYDLKKMVDDVQSTNPRSVIRDRVKEYRTLMDREQDILKKQLLAEKCAVCIGAEIDVLAITYYKELCNSNCFEEMKQLIGQTSNPFLLNGVYYARHANANAIAEHFDISEDFLREARSRANFVAPCIQVLFIILFEVTARLFRFEKNPTNEERRSLMIWAHVGLGCTESADLDSACVNMWRRSFILRMVFCLLGLGSRGNVIEKCPIDTSDIQEAKRLLADIDTHWEGIEIRRQMFYYLAKARVEELDKSGQMSVCETNLLKAIHMAENGRFKEYEYLTTYLMKIWELLPLHSAVGPPSQRHPLPGCSSADDTHLLDHSFPFSAEDIEVYCSCVIV